MGRCPQTTFNANQFELVRTKLVRLSEVNCYNLQKIRDSIDGLTKSILKLAALTHIEDCLLPTGINLVPKISAKTKDKVGRCYDLLIAAIDKAAEQSEDVFTYEEQSNFRQGANDHISEMRWSHVSERKYDLINSIALALVEYKENMTNPSPTQSSLWKE